MTPSTNLQALRNQDAYDDAVERLQLLSFSGMQFFAMAMACFGILFFSIVVVCFVIEAAQQPPKKRARILAPPSLKEVIDISTQPESERDVAATQGNSTEVKQE